MLKLNLNLGVCAMIGCIGAYQYNQRYSSYNVAREILRFPKCEENTILTFEEFSHKYKNFTFFQNNENPSKLIPMYKLTKVNDFDSFVKVQPYMYSRLYFCPLDNDIKIKVLKNNDFEIMRGTEYCVYKFGDPQIVKLYEYKIVDVLKYFNLVK